MIPQAIYWPVLLLATVATVIASQAVITGAFSLTQQAVQLGLLPAHRRSGAPPRPRPARSIVPQVNRALMIGVLVLLFDLPDLRQPGRAYGIAVTGAMFVDTLLVFVIVRRMWKRPLWQAALAARRASAVLDMIFISSNLLKIPDGAWLPLVLGAALVVMMWTWTRGAQILTDKTRRDSVPLTDLSRSSRPAPPHRAPGTAIFLTSDAGRWRPWP